MVQHRRVGAGKKGKQNLRGQAGCKSSKSSLSETGITVTTGGGASGGQGSTAVLCEAGFCKQKGKDVDRRQYPFLHLFPPLPTICIGDFGKNLLVRTVAPPTSNPASRAFSTRPTVQPLTTLGKVGQSP